MVYSYVLLLHLLHVWTAAVDGTVTPNHKEVEQGTDVTISCEVDNITANLTSVVWKDSDGYAISTTDTTNYVIDEGTFDNDSQTTTLTVKAIKNTEDTTYTCNITMSDNATEADTVNLKVYDVTLDDKKVSTNSAKTITCEITGLSTTATVFWTDPDGTVIADGADYTVDQGTESGGAQDSTLTITSAKLQALGTTSTFTCGVTSGEYTDSEASSNTMTLTTYKFDVTPHHKEVEQGTEVTISCVVDYITAALTSVVWKTSDDIEISTTGTTNYVIDEGTFDTDSQTTTLTVKAINNTEDTTYTCSITAADSTSGETPVNLKVYEVKLVDKTVDTDNAQTITCAITGLSTTANVSWTDGNGNAISNYDTDYTVVQGTQSGGEQDSTLAITSDKLKVLGRLSIFRCSVISGEYADSEVSSNTMTLYTSTFVTTTAKEVEQGTDVTLTCLIHSITSTATVAWSTRADHSITSDTTNYVIDTGAFDSSAYEQTTTLAVKAAANTEDTRYTCKFTADGLYYAKTVESFGFVVTLEDTSVLTTSAKTITCAITSLSSFNAIVSWTDPDGAAIADDADYTVDQGTVVAAAQESTLTINSIKLQALERTSTFTCGVTSGKYPESGSVSKTMTLTTEGICSDNVGVISGSVALVAAAVISASLAGGLYIMYRKKKSTTPARAAKPRNEEAL